MADAGCRHSPNNLELSGKNEMLLWCLTFLSSTWYIKNPFLKAKIVDVLFFGTWSWAEHRSVLTTLLNTHPIALKQLIPALMNFYIGTLRWHQLLPDYSIFLRGRTDGRELPVLR